MESDEHKTELIEYFTRHVNNGVFDLYTAEDVERIGLLLDDVHFPINEPCTVLDCGCGTGRSSELLARRLEKGSRVVGMDLTPAMVEHAKEIRSDNAGGSLEFTVGDCEQLPFEDAMFDWVVVLESFSHFPSTLTTLREFHRVLKDGGYVTILNRSSTDEINRFHANLDGPVSEDMMPDMTTLLLTMKEVGFWVEVYVDDQDGFRLLARK